MLSDRCLSVCLSVCLVTLVYCGQTVGWIKIPLDTEVGRTEVGPGPGDNLLDGDPAASHGKAHSSFMQFPPYFYFRFGHRRWTGVVCRRSAMSCTTYRLSRPLESRLTSNDARRRYFRFCQNRK